MRGGLILCAALLAATAFTAGTTAAGATRAASIQHVTVIGDSVADVNHLIEGFSRLVEAGRNAGMELDWRYGTGQETHSGAHRCAAAAL